MRPKLKPPGTQRLKLKCDVPPSTFDFKNNLRRCSLVGDDIYLTRERVYALADRLTKWVALRRKTAAERTVAVMLYGFPPGVGATGVACSTHAPRGFRVEGLWF
jgi:hypothetical protein